MISRATAICAALLALVSMSLGASNARAAQAQDAWDLIERMPKQARLVVVADNIDSTLESPQGRSLQRAIRDSGFFRPTFAQWAQLASRLGMEPDEALERILGRRAVFASSRVNPLPGPDPDNAGDWTLAIWVSEDIARLIRKKLSLVPRTKVASFPISAAEYGEFSLALMSEPARPGSKPQKVLVLSPASRSRLLEPVIRSLSQPKLESAPEPRSPRPPARADTVLSLRLAPESGSVISLSAHASPGGWDADIRVQEPTGESPRCGRRSINPDQFDTLSRDAIVLIMESVPDRLVPDRDQSLALTSTLIDIPERFLKLMGGRTIIRVRDSGAPEPGLELTIASEATYPGSVVAEGDRAIGALLEPSFGSVPPEGAIEGQYPSAVRTTTYDTNSPNPFGARARAEWAYSEPGLGEQRWWSLRVAPSAAPRASSLRRLCDEIASVPAPPASGLVSMGLVRPSKLLSAFTQAPWSGLGPIRAIARLERVSWTIQQDSPESAEASGDSCLISGSASLRLVPPESDRP